MLYADERTHDTRKYAVSNTSPKFPTTHPIDNNNNNNNSAEVDAFQYIDLIPFGDIGFEFSRSATSHHITITKIWTIVRGIHIAVGMEAYSKGVPCTGRKDFHTIPTNGNAVVRSIVSDGTVQKIQSIHQWIM
jgi:hypothetical protein